MTELLSLFQWRLVASGPAELNAVLLQESREADPCFFYPSVRRRSTEGQRAEVVLGVRFNTKGT